MDDERKGREGGLGWGGGGGASPAWRSRSPRLLGSAPALMDLTAGCRSGGSSAVGKRITDAGEERFVSPCDPLGYSVSEAATGELEGIKKNRRLRQSGVRKQERLHTHQALTQLKPCAPLPLIGSSPSLTPPAFSTSPVDSTPLTLFLTSPVSF